MEKSVIISNVDKYEQTLRLAYFWARTGPDFMHPIYTRGFDRCLAKVAPSVAAKMWLNVREHGQRQEPIFLHDHRNIIKPRSLWNKLNISIAFQGRKIRLS
jgi:hypothetical protein